MRILEERNLYQPLSTDLGKMEKQHNNLVVVRFLSALRLEFGSIQEQILCSLELPTLYEAYAQLQRHTLSGDSCGLNESYALVASHGNSGGSRRGCGGRGDCSTRGGRDSRGGGHSSGRDSKSVLIAAEIITPLFLLNPSWQTLLGCQPGFYSR